MALQQARSRPTRLTLAFVTVGLGLNLRASVLLGPHLQERFGAGPAAYVALVALPVLVAVLLRLPVGVLTDRYGARVMFPAVSLMSAASTVALGLAGSLPATAVAGAAAGVGSTAFVVGAALLSRTVPYGRRGRALGVFGLGVVVAGVLSILSWGFAPDGRAAGLTLAALLVVFAALSAALLRDPGRPGSPVRRWAELLRLAAGTSVSLLYVLALGGMVSIAAFLPVYLVAAFGFGWFRALAVTVVVAGLASVARLAGGRRTDLRPTAGLLTVCYGVAAGLCLVAALSPWPGPTVAAIAGVAVCDGIAGGALLALIGKAARPESAGAVLGVTGAAGALGALLPPALFTGGHALTGSYLTAWVLLAAALLAAALYVRSHGLTIGLGLAVEFAPEPSPTTMTVAVLGEPDTRWGAAAVVARLAELATSDELVVVYGSDPISGTGSGLGSGSGSGERPSPGLSAEALAAGLRARLPRHSVVAVRIAEQPETLGHEALRLVDHVEAGTLTIAVTSTAGLRSVAVDLSIYLQADRVLMVSYSPGEGAALQPA